MVLGLLLRLWRKVGRPDREVKSAATGMAKRSGPDASRMSRNCQHLACGLRASIDRTSEMKAMSMWVARDMS